MWIDGSLHAGSILREAGQIQQARRDTGSLALAGNLVGAGCRQDEFGTFKLRKGVKFHDGEPFNAQAVKVSIERTQKLGKGVAYIWASVKEVKVIDDYTVQFILNYPAAMDLVCGAVYGSDDLFAQSG